MPKAPTKASSRKSATKGKARLNVPDSPAATGQSKRTPVKEHRRSRSGCFTCRLRRKKCDEERPICQACTKHGLRCEYKPPQWWATEEQRDRQRGRVSDRIRQTRIMEKEGSLKDYMEQIKQMCRKSPANATAADTLLLGGAPSSSGNVNPYAEPYMAEPYVAEPYVAEPLPTPVTASTTTPMGTFNYDYRTENETMWTAPAMPVSNPYSASTTAYNPVNTVNPVNPINQVNPVSAINPVSQVSPVNPPVNPLQAMPTPEVNNDEWLNFSPAPTPTTMFPSQTQQLLKQQHNPNAYGYGYGSQQQGPLSSCLDSMVPISEADRPLLNHFIDHVIPLVFPMSEPLQTGPGRVREILGLVRTNRSYMHCCLSVSAIHLKTSMGMVDEMDHDIVKHRYEAICELTKALKNCNGNKVEFMDATLAIIFYNCSVGTSDDYLPDIPWHAHFKGVSNVVKMMNSAPSRLNVSLIAWIDILGATMLGETPHFAHTYRTKHLRGVSSGLQPLMGCDDRIMYLISEIACLESLKTEKQLDSLSICQHITALFGQLDWTEPLDATLEVPFTNTGEVRPDALIKIITTLFRLGARIYLFSLLPTFNADDPSISSLVTAVTDTLKYIPAGTHGFDRALVWPLFMAGAHSLPTSPFRRVMAERVMALGYLGSFGSFGRMYRVLKAVWRVADSTPSSPASSTSSEDASSSLALTQAMPDPAPELPHWRKVMKENKWDYLLM
ncbi:fungal-specific transcription factor domain-containing protein [Aspergillus aurantiobrunneus]